MTTLSLRRLWTIYKRTAVAQRFGNSMRDLALSHVAFYSGARRAAGTRSLLEHGETELALRTIRRLGRQIKAHQGRTYRKLQ
jgi:hypothetical protein